MRIKVCHSIYTRRFYQPPDTARLFLRIIGVSGNVRSALTVVGALITKTDSMPMH